MKCLKLATDFGEVDLTVELREAVCLLVSAADVLQLTVGEVAEFIASAPVSCPCCEAEESARANSYEH